MRRSGLQTVLVAVNAQYIHTGLGARSICAYAKQKAVGAVSLLEVTVNHREPEVLESLWAAQADVYLFSCYIWNTEMILRLVRDLRKLRPEAVIGLGGPQVGYQGPDFLRGLPEVDVILTGEGEETVCDLLGRLSQGQPLGECPGILCREGGQVVATPKRPPMEMDRLAFAYPDLDRLGRRIVYYESMRGCPFACSYCTSSIERGVRKRSLPLVFADLSVFLAQGVEQVKFVDRTFNCDEKHARGIWEWLVEHDNGVTNFHFELSGELLEEEDLAFLSGVRPGLFQFEIGVQSTNPATLREIDRPADVRRLFEKVRRLLQPGNLHVHLDLIAGLPHEGWDEFQSSFHAVYACLPHQLQMGFLKVLSGSKMEKKAEDYGLVYSSNAPYEVLSTRWMSYGQLCLLRGVARMVDLYYNSARFSHLLSHLLPHFDAPFSFYQLLWLHYANVTEGRPLSEMGAYDLLADFARKQGIPIDETMQWWAKYDLLLHEKPRKWPSWVTVDGSKEYRKPIQRFFQDPANIAAYLPEYQGEASTRVERTAHLEVFPFDPATGEPGAVAVVFNYKKRDLLGVALARTLPAEALARG